MAEITYTINQGTPEGVQGTEVFKQSDKELLQSFTVNSTFDSSKHLVELHILTLSDELIESDYNYNNYSILQGGQVGTVGASVLSIDPIRDVKAYDYNTGGVKLLYHFYNDIFTKDKSTAEFFIQEISPDRTELRLNNLTIPADQVISSATEVKNALDSQSFFKELRLNFKNNDLFIVTNIDITYQGDNPLVTVKLYEPLPSIYNTKDKLSVVEFVNDSVVYEVDSTVSIDQVKPITLQAPNFNLDLVDENVIPSQYFNYDELFSYQVGSSTNEIFSLFSEKGAEISIDHTDFQNFIHFSSAEERLLNFKYKLDLIDTYNNNLASIQNSVTSTGTQGSTEQFNGLIKGIVNNFDHYERYLYYESGSDAWPKSTTTKPYINKQSTDPEAINWFTAKRSEATYFDKQNPHQLLNTIPTYLRDDPNNEKYSIFIHMIAQHFDTLWLYSKSVTDKYDADNRLDKGISKDLVGEALKNFGIKIYTSNKSTEELFSSFIGQPYDQGTEQLDYYITGSLIGIDTPIAPSSFNNYQKEIQKRIYHNLSYLVKTKGTERGLRALINCFGIPSDILSIKTYGGRNTNERPFYGDYQHYTSSLDKIRLDHTGSIVEGSTLSSYTSIIKRDNKYTDDLHVIEVGFSPTDNVDKYIESQQSCTRYSLFNGSNNPTYYSYVDCTGTLVSNQLLIGYNFVSINASAGTVNTGSYSAITTSTSTAPTPFNIDDYIGNPSSLTLPSYDGLYQVAEDVLGDLTQYNVKDFVRLIKFFDNVIFKMVKDFIPARAVADTGIIIKPNLLNRSKAKSVKASVDTILSASMDNAFNYTSSIDTAFVEGKNGGSFETGLVESSTAYSQVILTPEGFKVIPLKNREEARFDGELLNSRIIATTGELNKSNPIKTSVPPRIQFDIQFYNTPPEALCTLAPNITSTVIVRPNVPYTLGQYFGSPGLSAPANTLYYLGPNATPTNQIYSPYTFTQPQYASQPIHANAQMPPEVTDPCNQTVNFRVVACTMDNSSNAPTTVVQGASYNLLQWFNQNDNLDVKFEIRQNGALIDTLTVDFNYTFDGSPNDEFTVTMIDNIDTSCRKSTVVRFYQCIISPENLTILTYAVDNINDNILLNLNDIFTGAISITQYFIQAISPGLSNVSAPDPGAWGFPVPLSGGEPYVGIITKGGAWVRMVNGVNCESIVRIVKSVGQNTALLVQNINKQSQPQWSCGLPIAVSQNFLADPNGAGYVPLPFQINVYCTLYGTEFLPINSLSELWQSGRRIYATAQDAIDGTSSSITGWLSQGAITVPYVNGHRDITLLNTTKALYGINTYGNTDPISCNDFS
jgi:hypothetical protein